MDISFLNGTPEQQQPITSAVGRLMNLSLDDIEFVWEIEFVDDPSVGLHNEFAYTDGASSRFRNDAPSFQSPYDGSPFYEETAIHELGHALLSMMASESLEAITALFGTTPFDWSPDVAWEDKPLEGIVETFKDAFFPRRFRRYANRTNHHISISKYPEFRRLWREGMSEETTTVHGALPQHWDNTHPSEWTQSPPDQDFLDTFGGVEGSYGADDEDADFYYTASLPPDFPGVFDEVQAILLDHMRELGQDVEVTFTGNKLLGSSAYPSAISPPGQEQFWFETTSATCDLFAVIGSQRSYPIDAGVRMIWKREDGSLFATDEQSLDRTATYTHGGGGAWDLDPIYVDEDWTFPIPDDAKCIAGFVYRQHLNWELMESDRHYADSPFGCVEFVEYWFQRVDHYTDFEFFRVDVTLPGFEVTVGGEVPPLPVPILAPGGVGQGRRPSRGRVVGTPA